jgi:hypothetical protein
MCWGLKPGTWNTEHALLLFPPFKVLLVIKRIHSDLRQYGIENKIHHKSIC